MKALALTPATGELRLVDRPEPGIDGPGRLKVRVLRVGVCGTDRDEVAGGRAASPPGQPDLILGHEMVGRVVEAADDVTGLTPGDLVVLMVRHGCGACPSCLHRRADMCTTGDYREHGIKGLDGFQCEVVVDDAADAVKVPPGLSEVGVLVEPLSIAEKAVDEATRVQEVRLPQVGGSGRLEGRRCLVAGLGPVGLLAAMALRLRGAEVFGLDVVDSGSTRPRWLEGIGGRYVDGRATNPDQVRQRFGPMDLVLDATGAARLELQLLGALADGGVCVLTGIPSGDPTIEVHGAALLRELVLRNQVVIGTVNAARAHYEAAVSDLDRAVRTWPGHPERLITRRVPYDRWRDVLGDHPPDEIKAVVDWEEQG